MPRNVEQDRKAIDEMRRMYAHDDEDLKVLSELENDIESQAGNTSAVLDRKTQVAGNVGHAVAVKFVESAGVVVPVRDIEAARQSGQQVGGDYNPGAHSHN